MDLKDVGLIKSTAAFWAFSIGCSWCSNEEEQIDRPESGMPNGKMKWFKLNGRYCCDECRIDFGLPEFYVARDW